MLYLGRVSFVFVALVTVALAGCDCAGPPTPRGTCTTSADCQPGQSCRDGMCRTSTGRDGDTDFDAFMPGYDAGPIPVATSLRVEPASADLVSTDGAIVTQTFSAVVVYDTGLELPATGPLFEIDTRTMGELAPSTGVFTANGIVGGTATVTASVLVGSTRLTGTAALSVRVERTVLGTDVSTDVPGRFDAATPMDDVTRAAGIVYPLSHVVFPENVYPADVQWTNGAPGDFFRVRITKADATITGYVGFDGNDHWLVDLLAWRSLAQSNPGTEATLTVDRLLSTGELITGAPVAMTFAQAALTGTVYYWDIVAGRIQRIDDGSGTAMSFLPNPEQGCVGCHSVSTSGRYMAGRLGGGDNVGTVFDLTTDLTVGVPSPSIWSTASHPLNWWFSSWSPDDTRLVVAAQGGPELRLYDPIGGARVAAPGLDGLIGTYPAWSRDGTRIAYVVNNSGWGDDLVTGDVAVLPVTGADTFGAPTIIHHGTDIPDGAADSYPTWSPDSALIAFGHGTGSRSESRSGDLFIMGADGASARALAQAASGAHEDFQPRFSPFTQGGFFWMSFLSRRVYGNPQIGNSTSAPSRRQQIWVTAIRVSASGTEDPSSVPYWLPGQNPHSANISAYWAPRPCRTDGEGCSVGSECCGGECLVDGTGALVCAPPPPDRCREYGETCSTDADCCESMDLVCSGHVCVHPGPG
jgi:hypothetical protein